MPVDRSKARVSHSEDENGRIQPQAIEVEQAVLGAMLLEREAIPRAIEVLADDWRALDPTGSVGQAQERRGIAVQRRAERCREAGADRPGYDGRHRPSPTFRRAPTLPSARIRYGVCLAL
jgi:hypothetical protein